MRSLILLLTLTITMLLYSACGSSDQSKSDTTNGAQALPTATIKQSSQSTTSASTTTTDNAPPVSVAHGAPPPNTATPQSNSPSGGPDTSALDKKIEQAEAKAKAPNAKQDDKQAAAAAYVERANVFYNAGQPMLYKFALRDFRLALRYDPNNADARDKRDQIVAIYQQMGRPVPELGNEP